MNYPVLRFTHRGFPALTPPTLPLFSGRLNLFHVDADSNKVTLKMETTCLFETLERIIL